MSHLTALQSKMTEQGISCVVVSSYVNQRYLTGLDYQDGYVLVTRERAYLLADFRYIEVAKATADPATTDVIMPAGSMLSCMADIIAKKGIDRVMYEETTLPCATRDRYAATFGEAVTLVPGASSLIDGLRLFKDEDEFACIRRAQKITDDAFSHILGFITPERTEIEVSLELEFYMRSHGSEGVAFDTIAVSGASSSKPHGVPADVKLTKNAFLTMDFGAKVGGYCADMTRTVVLGHADDDMKRLYNTVLKAQTAALEGIHCGMKCRDADTIARDIIDNAGYKGTFGHSLGHGVGMYIHEAPGFSQGAPETSLLAPGHVVTVEPGIYLEGKYGCRIEDMIGVMPDGSIVDFTRSDKSLIEL